MRRKKFPGIKILLRGNLYSKERKHNIFNVRNDKCYKQEWRVSYFIKENQGMFYWKTSEQKPQGSLETKPREYLGRVFLVEETLSAKDLKNNYTHVQVPHAAVWIQWYESSNWKTCKSSRFIWVFFKFSQQYFVVFRSEVLHFVKFIPISFSLLGCYYK